MIVVLGAVMAFLKFNIFKLLRYLKEELLLIIGTSTAEPALPGLMRKLEHAGVKRSVVGLVVPTGYSFNLDGAAIYLSLAAVYLAQATGTELTLGQQLGLVAVMLLTSKGAAGVAGGGFIELAATLSTIGTIPPAAIMLIFGIDKFMSECRAVVNFIGNAVATLFVGWWDRAVDSDRVRHVLDREPMPALPAELDATTTAGRGEQPARRRVPPAPAPRAPRARSAVPGRRRGSQARTGGTYPQRARRRRRGRALAGVAVRRSPMVIRWSHRRRTGMPVMTPRRCRHTAGTGADHKEIAMKVLVAPDEYKGSLTAAEVARHLAPGWSSAASPPAHCRSPTAATAASPPRSPPASAPSRSTSPRRPASGTPPRSPSTGPPPSSRWRAPAGCTPCPPARSLR